MKPRPSSRRVSPGSPARRSTITAARSSSSEAMRRSPSSTRPVRPSAPRRCSSSGSWRRPSLTRRFPFRLASAWTQARRSLWRAAIAAGPSTWPHGSAAGRGRGRSSPARASSSSPARWRGSGSRTEGELHLKGLDEPVRVFRVISEDGDPAEEFRRLAPAKPARGTCTAPRGAPASGPGRRGGPRARRGGRDPHDVRAARRWPG